LQRAKKYLGRQEDSGLIPAKKIPTSRLCQPPSCGVTSRGDARGAQKLLVQSPPSYNHAVAAKSAPAFGHLVASGLTRNSIVAADLAPPTTIVLRAATILDKSVVLSHVHFLVFSDDGTSGWSPEPSYQPYQRAHTRQAEQTILRGNAGETCVTVVAQSAKGYPWDCLLVSLLAVWAMIPRNPRRNGMSLGRMWHPSWERQDASPPLFSRSTTGRLSAIRHLTSPSESLTTASAVC
jgi:hypothetical protein